MLQINQSVALSAALARGSCSEAVYREILAEIEKRCPCNVLVFGCGRDSQLWHQTNKGGRTLFIEDQPRWAKLARKAGCEVLTTTYHSKRNVDAPEGPPPEELHGVLRQTWDVVFIDGPKAYRRNTPGRELPIRWASRLPGAPVVFLHDYPRRHETYHATRYLGEPLRIVDKTLAVWQRKDTRTLTTMVPDYAWTYWDGVRPVWIELCLETMRRNIPGIHVLTPTTLARLYAKHRSPGDPYDLLSGMPALHQACQRSNVIRAWLLKTLGGMWIDADCIVFTDVRELCRKYIAGKDLVTYKYRKRFSVDAILMSAANGRIINEYARLQQEILRRRQHHIHRMAIGPPALRRAIVTVGANKVGVIPTKLVDPALGGRNHQYLAENKLPEGCACVMLRAGTGKNKLLWTRDQWLDSNCYLSAVFRRALGMK